VHHEYGRLTLATTGLLSVYMARGWDEMKHTTDGRITTTCFGADAKGEADNGNDI